MKGNKNSNKNNRYSKYTFEVERNFDEVPLFRGVYM